jgi:hypothetical protein
VTIVAQQLHQREHGVALVVSDKDAERWRHRRASCRYFPQEKRALFRYVSPLVVIGSG